MKSIKLLESSSCVAISCPSARHSGRTLDTAEARSIWENDTFAGKSRLEIAATSKPCFVYMRIPALIDFPPLYPTRGWNELKLIANFHFDHRMCSPLPIGIVLREQINSIKSSHWFRSSKNEFSSFSRAQRRIEEGFSLVFMRSLIVKVCCAIH